MKLNLTIFALLACLAANADDLYVVPFGTSPNFSSISDAVNAASDGDKILVLPGDYYGEIDINKSVTISPVNLGDTYNVFGNLKFSAIYSNTTKESIITGAVIYNNVSLEGMSGSSGTMNAVFISCEFINEVSFTSDNNKFTANFFYNTFKSNLTAKSTSRIIGNTFTKDLMSTSVTGQVSIYNSSTSPNDSETLKIIANKFQNFKLSFLGYSDDNYNPFYDELVISNNYFIRNTSNSMQSSDAIISVDGSYLTMSDVHLSIVNNVIRAKTSSTYQSRLIYLNKQFASNKIINNLFSSNFSSTDQALIQFNSNLVLFQNNIYISNVNTECPDSYTSSAVTYFFTGTPASAEISDNQCFNYSENLNDTYIMMNGYPSLSFQSVVSNQGKNSVEYRDIDNTINDIGILGGPNTWTNYHDNETDGTSRIIELTVPSIIYPIGNTTIDIKGKAISIN